MVFWNSKGYRFYLFVLNYGKGQHDRALISALSLFFLFDVRSFLHSIVRAVFYSFVGSFVTFVVAFIRLFIQSFVRLFIHSFVRFTSVRSFIYLFIDRFVRYVCLLMEETRLIQGILTDKSYWYCQVLRF